MSWITCQKAEVSFSVILMMWLHSLAISGLKLSEHFPVLSLIGQIVTINYFRINSRDKTTYGGWWEKDLRATHCYADNWNTVPAGESGQKTDLCLPGNLCIRNRSYLVLLYSILSHNIRESFAYFLLRQFQQVPWKIKQYLIFMVLTIHQV